MSTNPHATDTPGHPGAVDHHSTSDHGEEPLGPIDVAAWGAGVLGVLVGVAIAVCFAVATAAPA